MTLAVLNLDLGHASPVFLSYICSTMLYVGLFIAGLIVLLGAFSYFKNKQTAQKRLENIRQKWGKRTDTGRNYKLIAGFIDEQDHPQLLSEATQADIDMEAIFAFVDRTNSKPGQQYLYKRLLTASSSAQDLKTVDQQVETLAAQRPLQEKIELELSKLGGNNAYYLPELFKRELKPLFGPLLTFYIKTAGIIMLTLIVLLILTHNQFYFLLLLAMLIANTVLHYGTKGKVYQFTHSLPQLLILVDVAKWLTQHAPIPVAGSLQANLQHISKLKRSLRFVSFEGDAPVDPTDLAYTLFELLKMIFLLEPRSFVISLDRVNQHRADIKAVFEYVGYVDSLISIHSFRLSLPYFSKPNFTAKQNIIDIKGVYHPLVTDCVANDILTNADQGVLITGSNMSGKTTFIRAMAINTLLAQVLFTSCSLSHQAPRLNIHTSIRISDDVEEHKSYFQAEAISVLDIVNRCGADEPVKGLIIIDEIFRGTNTIERIAAAKAVLAYLTANKNFVFVSTHDLELAELLGTDYAVYSFEEHIADGTRLSFDYKIKPGLLKNKNGIAILQALGFPASVVKDASSVSEQLRAKYLL